MYIFATQHGLTLLQAEAFKMARASCDDPLKLRMRLDRRDLICECIRDLVPFIIVADPMMGFIDYIMRIHGRQPG